MEPFINISNNEKHGIKEINNHIKNLKIFDKEKRKYIKKNINYFGETIKYNHNSYGYRTRSVLPEEYILNFGCSHTYGTGLHEHERYSNIIEESAKLPVINLGVHGSSVNFILLNFLKLIASFSTLPKIIILQCPNLDRLAMPKSNGHLSVTPADRQYKTLYYTDSLKTHNLICYDILTRLIKKEKIKLIDFFLWNSVGAKQFKPIDWARDFDHPGPETNREIAKYILENI